tara:strand:+ start:181 stop:411 length:231 start_codon:yes stop_codon:yes gene_type:complete
MTNKGFVENEINSETLDNLNISEKPLSNMVKKTKRVDINILKSKLQKTEEKEFKKNLIILSMFLTTLALLGIFLSS